MSQDTFDRLLEREQADAYRRAAVAYATAQPDQHGSRGDTRSGADVDGAKHAAPARRPRQRVRWIRAPRDRQLLPSAPSWFAALIAALVATLIGLIALGAAIVFWMWGASYTLQGIDQGLQWLARERAMPQILTWWRQLGSAQWAVPIAFSCSEMIWAPIRRFLPRAQKPVFIIAAIFAATDILTTHVALPIAQPWRLIGAIGLTFLPESAGLWAIQFIAEGWLHLWTTLRTTSEAS